MSADELLEAFDDCGRFLGLFPRSECHKNNALAHRAVHILVFNDEGDIILQKRSGMKDLYPYMWDTSVGGHLSPKESYLEGAIRECEEELGFTPIKLHWLYKYTMKGESETELVETFLTIFNGPFKPSKEEISEIGSFKVEVLFFEEAKNFSPFFLRELDEFKNFLRKGGFYNEGTDNWWRRDVWQRFIAYLEERKN